MSEGVRVERDGACLVLAFDRPIEPSGILGPPLPTMARVTNRPVFAGKATYGADENTTRLRTWIDAAPGNRAKLNDWLNANAQGVGIALFLNGSEYAQARANAVAALIK